MNYEVKKVEDAKYEIVITLKGDEFKKLNKEVTQNIKEKAAIPGFRKGKAPETFIKQNFSNAIKEEIVEKIVKTEYFNIVEKEGLNPIDYPHVTDIKTEEDLMEIKLTVFTLPEVKLGEYKGLQVKKEEYKFDEKMLEEEIKSLVEQNTVLKEAEEGAIVEEGDTVNISFEGFVDGVAFEGGKAESYSLKIGSKTFIDTFEEQIKGHKTGDAFDVNVTFPENYGQKELASKPAVFKVEVKGIKRPANIEINDDFAKDMGYENIEEMKESKKIEIQKREENILERGFINSLLEKIKVGSEVKVPEIMIKREIGYRIKEIEDQLKNQGASLELYLAMNRMTREKLEEEIKPMAEDKVKIDLILAEISKVEGIKVSDEELEMKLAEVAEYYNIEVEKLKSDLRRAGNYENFIESLKLEKLVQKTMDFIVSETIKD